MKKILIISIALLISVSAFCQLDITKRTVTTDTLRSRSDKMYFSNGLGSITWIKTSGDSLFFNDATGTFSLSDFSSSSYYGEMHMIALSKDYGDPVDYQWIPIDTFATGILNGFTFTETDSVDYLNVTNTGVYEITYNIGFTLTWLNSPTESTISVFINDTRIEKADWNVYTQSSVEESITKSFFLSLTAGDKIKVKIYPNYDVYNLVLRNAIVTVKSL